MQTQSFANLPSVAKPRRSAGGVLALAAGLLFLATEEVGTSAPAPSSSPSVGQSGQPWSSEVLAADFTSHQTTHGTAGEYQPGSDYEHVFRQGIALENQGRRREAFDVYRRLVTDYPTRYEAYHRLGVLADTDKRHLEAQRWYTDAYRLNCEDPELLRDMGRCLLLQEKWTLATAALERAVRLDRQNVEHRQDLQAAYRRIGRPEQAARLSPVFAESAPGEPLPEPPLRSVRPDLPGMPCVKPRFSDTLGSEPTIQPARPVEPRARGDLMPGENVAAKATAMPPRQAVQAAVEPSGSRFSPQVSLPQQRSASAPNSSLPVQASSLPVARTPVVCTPPVVRLPAEALPPCEQVLPPGVSLEVKNSPPPSALTSLAIALPAEASPPSVWSLTEASQRLEVSLTQADPKPKASFAQEAQMLLQPPTVWLPPEGSAEPEPTASSQALALAATTPTTSPHGGILSTAGRQKRRELPATCSEPARLTLRQPRIAGKEAAPPNTVGRISFSSPAEPQELSGLLMTPGIRITALLPSKKTAVQLAADAPTEGLTSGPIHHLPRLTTPPGQTEAFTDTSPPNPQSTRVGPATRGFLQFAGKLLHPSSARTARGLRPPQRAASGAATSQQAVVPSTEPPAATLAVGYTPATGPAQSPADAASPAASATAQPQPRALLPEPSEEILIGDWPMSREMRIRPAAFVAPQSQTSGPGAKQTWRTSADRPDAEALWPEPAEDAGSAAASDVN